MITVWHNASFPNAIKRRILPRWMQLLEKRRGEEDRSTINYTGSVAKKKKRGKRKKEGKKEGGKKKRRISLERERNRILVTTYISTRSSRDDVWTKGNRIKKLRKFELKRRGMIVGWKDVERRSMNIIKKNIYIYMKL